MRIGSFAGVVFEVSSKKALTFDDLSRSSSARWAVHDINLQKPLPEFVGAGQESVSFKVLLKGTHGVNPESTMKALRAFRDAGKYSSLIIGSKPVTSGYFYLEDIQETHRNIDNRGVSHTIEATLTLKEYPKNKPIRNKPKKKPPAKKPSTKSTTGTATVKVGMLNCRVSPNLNARIVRVLRKGYSFKVYKIVSGSGIKWYYLGNGQYVSAVSTYTNFKKS